MTPSPDDDSNDDTPGSLIYRIHAANDRDDEWHDVLDLLRGWLRARASSLSRHHFARGQGDMLYDAPRDPEFRAAYAEFAPRNPWFLSNLDYTAGRVMTGDELLGERELQRTDFYRSLLKPRRLFHRLCGVLARRGDLVYFIDAHRGEDEAPFSERDKSKLRGALPHLSLALENRWRSLQAGDLTKALMRIVDQDSHPTLLVTEDCRVLYRNASAAELDMQSNGMHVRDGGLSAATASDNRSLREAVLEVARHEAAGNEGASRVVTISAPGAQHPSILIVRAAGRTFLSAAGEFRELVVVTLRNAHSEHDPRSCPFARQFELTPAQARVNALVFSGHPLSNIARALHVSENTVRTHLKQIFQKTNTHGQMELVHLHARVCADRR